MWVKTSVVRDIIQGAARYGTSVQALCAACSISESELSDGDATMDWKRAQNVWQQAVALTGEPNLGLLIGTHTSTASMGLVGYLMENSPTLRTAFQQLSGFNSLVTDMFSYELKEDTLVLSPHPMWTSTYPATAQQAVMQAVAGCLHVSRVLTGKNITPVIITFSFPKPPSLQQYQEILHASIVFQSAHNTIVFGHNDLDKPVIGYNQALRTLFQQILAQALHTTTQEAAITTDVKNLLFKLAPVFNLADVAAALHLTPRTLQRKLHDAGSTFNQMCEQVKQEIATGLLEKGKISIQEVAYMTGYADARIFRNAFKKWTGTSPTNYSRRTNK
ncbi:helix-turn-helix protein [Chitinophaga skermanii]|uniref:Helix-turn-helix protein n=1 Tax=Chitinophaga skermanii TaxID=331697 RepID=A0A327QP52_9BACT|nr:AraC family transcriptional regulator [Chitinophaga skermanii]RAJ05123.1 helix-turn-helix protein [Chitinophaga skermanii]